MSDEVDFTGWVRSDENLDKMENSFWHRWKLHWRRSILSVKQKRWHHFTWWNIRGLLLNQKKTF